MRGLAACESIDRSRATPAKGDNGNWTPQFLADVNRDVAIGAEGNLPGRFRMGGNQLAGMVAAGRLRRKRRFRAGPRNERAVRPEEVGVARPGEC